LPDQHRKARLAAAIDAVTVGAFLLIEPFAVFQIALQLRDDNHLLHRQQARQGVIGRL
jgi:hypothetical protein